MGGKSRINPDELAIWQRCWGPHGLGLSVLETWNAVDIIRKHLGVQPRMLLFGDEVKAFKPQDFRDFERRCREPGMPDTYLGALYHAEDLAVLGCSESTVHRWASALGQNLGCPLDQCLIMRPYGVGRLYYTEFLVFFVLAYSNDAVWEQPVLANRLFQVWEKLGKLLGVQACPIIKARQGRIRKSTPKARAAVSRDLAVPPVGTFPPPSFTENTMDLDQMIAQKQEEIKRLSLEIQEAERAKARQKAVKASIRHEQSELSSEEPGIYDSIVVDYPDGQQAVYLLDSVTGK